MFFPEGKQIGVHFSISSGLQAALRFAAGLHLGAWRSQEPRALHYPGKRLCSQRMRRGSSQERPLLGEGLRCCAQAVLEAIKLWGRWVEEEEEEVSSAPCWELMAEPGTLHGACGCFCQSCWVLRSEMGVGSRLTLVVVSPALRPG